VKIAFLVLQIQIINEKIRCIFKNDFEITDNADDFVTSEDIQKWINEKKLGITITKFGNEMNKYCKINKLENVMSKPKKISGKTRRVWVAFNKL